jgi:hypothetical protein
MPKPYYYTITDALDGFRTYRASGDTLEEATEKAIALAKKIIEENLQIFNYCNEGALTREKAIRGILFYRVTPKAVNNHYVTLPLD